MSRKWTELYPMHQTISRNPPVREVPVASYPKLHTSVVMGSHAMVIGDVEIDKDVFLGFHCVIRADSAFPFYLGPRCNIQDFVLMHCHPGHGMQIHGKTMGVFLAGDVSVLHHAAVHGPVYVGKNTFIGQAVNIYHATIGADCVIMHGATITEGVRLRDGSFVAPGQSVYSQEQADALPHVPADKKSLNQEIIDHYFRLSKSYQRNTPLVIPTDAGGAGRPLSD